MRKIFLLQMCCLIAVLLTSVMYAANCQDNTGSSPSKSILIYILSNRSDNSHWYKDPADLNPLKEVLNDKGYSVDVKDKLILPTILIDDMRNYQEVWILEGDWNDIVDVTPKEAADLHQYYEMGKGIWISFETTYPPDNTYGSWNEDATVFARVFGVDWASYDTGDTRGKTVFSDHPIFKDVHSIYFDNIVGCLCSKNPSVDILWSYSPTCQGVAVLDGRMEGQGRVVFDSGWILGYTYLNKEDDLLLASNIADWLYPG
jgi:hypothetical protein